MRYSVASVIESSCSPFAVWGFAANQDHTVVGSFFCGAGYDQAFVALAGGALTPLDLPGAGSSKAFDINDAGVIVGSADVGNTTSAFVYQTGRTQLLGTLPGGNFSEATGINGSGVVCGVAGNLITGPKHAFFWDGAGDIVDLDLPVGPNNDAADINDAGQIVGWMGSSPGGSFYAEAFVWQDGNTTPLGVPSPGVSSRAYAINDAGEVCGAYFWPQPGGGLSNGRACLWSAGEMIDLGIPTGFTRSVALDLDDHGTVVGYCEGVGLYTDALLWRDDQMHRLIDLLAPGTHVLGLTFPVSINRAGDITAGAAMSGGTAPTVVLTPVAPRDGDTDCDWVVDVDDLINVILSWGALVAQSGSGSPDVNGDGMVGVDDLVMVLVNWG